MTDRIKKVDSLLKRELNGIILKEVDFPKNILVTLTRVETSTGLNQARVFISVMPDNKTEEISKILKKNIYNIQQILNKRLNMRPVPKIVFKVEKKTEEAAKIEELLEEIKREEKAQDN